jgi:dGTPase
MAKDEKLKFYITNDDSIKQYFDSSKRRVEEPIQEYRSEFSRDRDRILYSSAFRRLSGKTQIFIAGFDTHARTRLTHTLEVCQISTTIALALKLNATLCEAISYGHDIGHAPFGHMGERIINYIMNNCTVLDDFKLGIKKNNYGFKHNLQSVRILQNLEMNSDINPGLNLTYFTLWGILNHTKTEWGDDCEAKDGRGYCSIMPKKKCEINEKLSVDYYEKYKKNLDDKKYWSIEGYIVRWADEIAQRHHDLEDGLITQTIEPDEITIGLKKTFPGFEEESIYNEKLNEIKKEIEGDKNIFLISTIFSKMVVNLYVTKYIEDYKEIIKGISSRYDINCNKDFWDNRNKIFNDSEFDKIKNYQKYFKEDKNIRDLLNHRIILSENVQIMNSKGMMILRKLFEAFLTNALQLPDEIIISIFKEYNKKSNKSGKNGIEFQKTESGYYKNIAMKRNEIFSQQNKRYDENYQQILCRTICDYLSNMTDEFALNQYKKLYESVEFKNF